MTTHIQNRLGTCGTFGRKQLQIVMLTVGHLVLFIKYRRANAAAAVAAPEVLRMPQATHGRDDLTTNLPMTRATNILRDAASGLDSLLGQLVHRQRIHKRLEFARGLQSRVRAGGCAGRVWRGCWRGRREWGGREWHVYQTTVTVHLEPGGVYYICDVRVWSPISRKQISEWLKAFNWAII